jgi:hypothetical protein
MIEISRNTKRRIEAMFPRADWDRVSAHLVNECGSNLPLIDASYDELAERIRFAVLKLSSGNFEKLVEETQMAAKDWRDRLVAAGFGDDPRAHLAWKPDNDDST